MVLRDVDAMSEFYCPHNKRQNALWVPLEHSIKKKKARQINEYQNTPPVLPVFSFSNLYMDLWKGFDQLLFI